MLNHMSTMQCVVFTVNCNINKLRRKDQWESDELIQQENEYTKDQWTIEQNKYNRKLNAINLIGI